MSNDTRRLVLWGAAAVLIAAMATLGWFHRQDVRALFVRDSITPAAMTMDAAASGAGTAGGSVSIDQRRRQLIGVRTTAARRTSVASPIRAVGVVRADESRLMDVNVKVEGWIRDLRADFTGAPVEKGQPLFSLYSPDLLATEREYVLAIKSREGVRESILPEARQRADSLVASARQRLQLWDVPAEQIARLEKTLEPELTTTVRSPVDGYVLEKAAVEGMHVAPGQTLYRLANLGVVWIEADAYEHDLAALRIGAVAHVTLDAYPGERLSARVVFISPSLQPETRTAKVRFELANPRGRLKPEMYANVEIATTASPAIVVPIDAVLDSGREQIVFVAEGDGVFTPRAVQIGARRQDVIEIASGLKEGEQVATSAAFFLDSESQLRSSFSDVPPQPSTPTAPGVQAATTITLRTQPDPPVSGRNTFEVSVTDAAGRPVTGAEVAILFYMPGMPAMGMPAMRNTVTLAPMGGVYRGAGEILISGQWNVTVEVRVAGRPIAKKTLSLTAS